MVLIGAKPTLRLTVKDASYVGSVRRAVRDRAMELGFSGEPLERLSIISTELATNLSKHSHGGGEIFFYDKSTADMPLAKLLSVDRGPGIENVDEALVDGMSTTSTMGGGLGAIKRQSDNFAISSEPGKGTVIECWVGQSEPRRSSTKAARFDAGFVSVAHPGETCCGDAVSIAISESRASIFVIDGLGHGQGAEVAAQMAIQSFERAPFDDTKQLLERVHKEIAGTRGAAVALAQINQDEHTLIFSGVGNIAARIFTKYDSTGCVSSSGIVGGQSGTVKQYSYEWPAGARLLMHSDGIKSAAKLDFRSASSAGVTAAEIYRDFARSTDDVTVVVVRDLRGL